MTFIKLPITIDIQKNKHYKILVIFGSLIIILLTGCLIYSNTLNADFIFDDYPFIIEDNAIRITELSWDSVCFAALKGYPRDRLLPNLSFGLNYYAGFYNVTGYHLVNITIHLLTAIFLFCFTLALFRHYSPMPDFNNPEILAFFVSLLWMVIPLHTQAVTYITQRMASMAAMFFILSMWLYAAGRLACKENLPVKSGFCLMGCLFSGICALASKENTATLPLTILLFEWFFIQDLKIKWSKQKVIGTMFCGIVFIAIIFYFTSGNPFDRILAGYKYRDFSMAERVMTQFRVIIFYISQLIYPIPERLALDHGYPLSQSLVQPLTTIMSFTALFALIWLAIQTTRRYRIFAFCIFWFFITLAIESSIIGIEIFFEHRMYLPSMMLCLMSVLLLFQCTRQKKIASVSILSIVILFSVWSYQRNNTWNDEFTLYRDCAQKSPNDPRALNNLGAVINKKGGDIHTAIEYFKKAHQIDPSYAPALYSWGLALIKEDMDLDFAIDLLKESLTLDPRYYEAYAQIGVALQKKGDLHQAVAYYNKALKRSKLYSFAHYNLAKTFIELDETDKAMQILTFLLHINPHTKEAHNDIAQILISQQKYSEAIIHLKELLDQNPYHEEANINIAIALTHINSIDDAISHYQTAIISNPENAQAHIRLGDLFRLQNRLEDAQSHYRTALLLNAGSAGKSIIEGLEVMRQTKKGPEHRLRKEVIDHPENPETLFRLGKFYKNTGLNDRAVAVFFSVIQINPKHMGALFEIAHIFTEQKNLDTAIIALKFAESNQPDNPVIDYNLACLFARQNKSPEAVKWLKKAVNKGYKNWNHIKSDPDLKNIRANEYIKNIIDY